MKSRKFFRTPCRSDSEFESLKGRCISSEDRWQEDFHRTVCKITTKKRLVSKYSGFWQKVTLWCQHCRMILDIAEPQSFWKSLNLSTFENLATSPSTCSFPFTSRYSQNLILQEVWWLWQVTWHWTSLISTYLFTVLKLNTYLIDSRAV